jgi:hypothetical protein
VTGRAPARRRSGGRALQLVLAAFVLSGCGGSDAEAIIERAAESLAEVRSGEVAVRVTTGPLEGEGADVGFEVTGPFSTADADPRAQLTYRQVVADTEQVTVVTAIGDAAYIEVDGQAYELDDPPPALTAGPLADVDLAAWLVDPVVAEDADGGHTVEADLDAAVVLRDLLALASGAGAGDALGELAAADADAIRRAARSASAVLETAGDEGYLRRLHGRIDFATDVADAIGAAGARIEFELGLTRHGEPVTITAPPSARPQSDLPSRGRTG